MLPQFSVANRPFSTTASTPPHPPLNSTSLEPQNVKLSFTDALAHLLSFFGLAVIFVCSVVVLQIVRRAKHSRSRPKARPAPPRPLSQKEGGSLDGEETTWPSVTFSDLVSRWQEEFKAAAESAALSGETLLLEDDQVDGSDQGRLSRLIGGVYRSCAGAISYSASFVWERREIVDRGLTGLNNLGNTCKCHWTWCYEASIPSPHTIPVSSPSSLANSTPHLCSTFPSSSSFLFFFCCCCFFFDRLHELGVTVS